MGVDLNLVPFIDFLSCLIAFLMITAVWTEISALEHEQLISNAPVEVIPQDPPPPPPLTIKITSEGYVVMRKPEDFKAIPKIQGNPDDKETPIDDQGKSNDYPKLEEAINADHTAYPSETMVVINTDDGIPYEEMIKVLDVTRKIGYPQSALAGGPPSTNPLAPPPPTTPPPQ